jgi:hypothetical protein
VFRADLYRRYVTPSAAPLGIALPFDRVEFSAADIATYLEQFSVATAFVDRSQTLHS